MLKLVLQIVRYDSLVLHLVLDLVVDLVLEQPPWVSGDTASPTYIPVAKLVSRRRRPSDLLEEGENTTQIYFI